MNRPRRLRRSTLLSLFLLCGVGPSARAQLTEARPGARVRIVAPGIVAGRYVGTVLTRDSTVIRVGDPSNSPVDIPIGRITSLEVSRGDSRSAGAAHGIMWGVSIGLGLGLALAPTIKVCDVTCHGPSPSEKRAFVGGAVVGGLFWGAVVGALMGRERSERFDLPARVGATRRDGRTELALSIAY